MRHHRTLQLATHQATDPNLKGLTLQWRGYFAFDAEASDERLAQLLAEGWTLQTTQFSAWHGWDAFKVRMDETGQDWLLLGGVSASGMLWLYSREQRCKLEAGWTVLCFGPPATAAVAPASASPQRGSVEP